MKKTNFSILPFLFLALVLINCGGQTKSDIITGADQTNKYLPYLEGKNVALTINHSSVIGGTPILDSLMSLGIKVIIAFGPEHGIRGNASAGAPIENDTDEKTSIPIISLYGDYMSGPFCLYRNSEKTRSLYKKISGISEILGDPSHFAMDENNKMETGYLELSNLVLRIRYLLTELFSLRILKTFNELIVCSFKGASGSNLIKHKKLFDHILL